MIILNIGTVFARILSSNVKSDLTVAGTRYPPVAANTCWISITSSGSSGWGGVRVGLPLPVISSIAHLSLPRIPLILRSPFSWRCITIVIYT